MSIQGRQPPATLSAVLQIARLESWERMLGFFLRGPNSITGWTAVSDRRSLV